MSFPSLASLTDPDVNRKQQARVKRLLLAVAVYVPCALMLSMVTWLGFLPPWFVPTWVVIFAGANAVFYALIKVGLNLRFKDPSMTMAQMAVSMGAVALILYHADAIRGGMLMLLLVILLFGVLRLTTAELLVMGALASAAYAAVIVLLIIYKPEQVHLRVEWTQWATLTTTLAVMCPLVGYMSGVRRQLSKSLGMIKDMAHHDALTGLFNRHHMADTVAKEINRCERGSAPFLLAIADIDHFKRINDTHGHLVGNEVLKAVADGIRTVLRKADYMARYGGEEFVIVLAAANLTEARAGCERLRMHAQQLHIPQLGQDCVSISIGGAFYRPGDSQTSLLGRADAALYQAKNLGRNRVELDSHGPA